MGRQEKAGARREWGPEPLAREDVEGDARQAARCVAAERWVVGQLPQRNFTGTGEQLSKGIEELVSAEGMKSRVDAVLAGFGFQGPWFIQLDGIDGEANEVLIVGIRI